jgi:hypothetical protein
MHICIFIDTGLEKLKTLIAKIVYPLSDISFLKGFSSFNCSDGMFVSTIYPQQNAFKFTSNLNKSAAHDESLLLVNLIFDECDNKHGIENAINIGNQKFVYFGFKQIQSPEAFANFAFEVGIDGFKTPDNFWVPFETALTKRQLEILFFVYRGFSSKKIAEHLNLSQRTVELHRQNCISKIGPLSPKKLEGIFSFTLIEALSLTSNL